MFSRALIGYLGSEYIALFELAQVSERVRLSAEVDQFLSFTSFKSSSFQILIFFELDIILALKRRFIRARFFIHNSGMRMVRM